ncbi:hypothetical protein [Bradyrhizobium cenepequi]
MAWLASIGPGLSAETGRPKDFALAIQSIMGNLRTAASYIRTGNLALAQIETEDALTEWKDVENEATMSPSPYLPAALDDFVSRGRERLSTVAAELGSGDSVAAGRELLALRQSFHDLRRSSGLYDLGDCVFEIAPAMDMLKVAASRFGEQPVRSHAEDIVAAASAFRDRLQRCNEWANADIARQPEFRRLMDGAIASAGEIAHAAMAGDGPLVHRYLVELQSYAQLLDFRFG